MWIRQTPTGLSICQIGTVHGRDGVVVDRWQTLVNSEDWVDPWNVSVHVIAENQSATDRWTPGVADTKSGRESGRWPAVSGELAMSQLGVEVR